MSDLPKALKDGILDLGFIKIPCAVLKDGTRLITTSAVNKALGRANPSSKKDKNVAIDMMPPFLNLLIFKPYITNELTSSTSPIAFQMKNSVKAFGYKAEALPQICEIFLKARDDGVLTGKQLEHAAMADLIIRSLAKVGIISLVDEATGYQELRDKTALQALLDKYLSVEAAKWAKTFPDEFYLNIFRLKKWNPTKEIRHKPQAVAGITKDLVYKRLAPELLETLEEKNPVTETGRRKACHHQFLSREQGLTHLKGHIFMLQKLMRSSSDWDDFMKKVNDFLPYATTDDIDISI